MAIVDLESFHMIQSSRQIQADLVEDYCELLWGFQSKIVVTLNKHHDVVLAITIKTKGGSVKCGHCMDARNEEGSVSAVMIWFNLPNGFAVALEESVKSEHVMTGDHGPSVWYDRFHSRTKFLPNGEDCAS